MSVAFYKLQSAKIQQKQSCRIAFAFFFTFFSLSFLLYCTFGAYSFQHKVYTGKSVTSGQTDFGNIYFVQTSGALTLLAIKVSVHIAVGFIVVAHTKFIANNIVAIFHLVYNVLITKQCKCAEYTRFIYCL